MDELETLHGDTVDSDAISAPERVSLPSPEVSAHSFEDRYRTLRVLGQGGMGEVLLCSDRQVGRQVALKVMRPQARESGIAEARFIREARVQGQLEHPAVVPVYDLGVSRGEVYFTMKRVRGDTLEDVITGMRDGVPEITERYSRHRLLTAFASVCLAVDYAHERGVLHRDLKPANIMLGDYGEVYVLDWGLARLGEPDPELGLDSTEVSLDLSGETKPGAVLGTPGYMSPEQTRGQHEELTPASDVYGLGAVLYELLTYEPLHERSTIAAVVTATLEGADARASLRAPQALVPPELEAICVRATALEPEERFAGARELHDELEDFLAGQRDTSLRQQMAGEHALRAAEAFEGSENESDPIGDRRIAMRELGRALALDPGNERAMGTMARILSEPPNELPPEVALELERATSDKARWNGRIGVFTYGSLIVYLPLLAWIGVNDWTALFVFYSLASVCVALSAWTAKARRPRNWMVVVTMLASNVMFTVLWGLFGPFVALPPILVANTAAFASHLTGRNRVLAVVVGCVCAVGPVLLEVLGVLEPTFHFEGEYLVLHWAALAGSPGPTLLLLGTISVAAIATCAVALTRVRDALGDAERRLYLYAWHLRELVPEAVRPVTDPTIGRRTA